jgi:hypothetical protein
MLNLAENRSKRRREFIGLPDTVELGLQSSERQGGEARDEPIRDGIADLGNNDGDRLGRVLGRAGSPARGPR